MRNAIRTVAAVVTTAAIAGFALSAPAAQASSTQDAILEDAGQLLSNPSHTLAILRELGVDRVRVNLKWYSVAPASGSHRKPHHFNASDPGAYPRAGWALYDEIVRIAQADGIGVLITLSGPGPVWATGPGLPHGGPSGVWKPSASEYGLFARAVATRYSGHYTPRGTTGALPRVSWWSIWNEANYGVDLAPQAIDHGSVEVGAAQYRKLLDAAWSGLHHTGHGGDTILIGETAPRGVAVPGNFSGVKPLRFLRALYCVDSRYRPLRGSAARGRRCPTSSAASSRFRSQHPALFQSSGFADHPYEQGVKPNTPTYACGSRVCAGRSDPDYADLPEIPRLERALDRFGRIYGSHNHLPVYSTEYGYWTKPPDPAATIGPTTAAFYINWAEYLSWRQPRIRSYDQYLLVDPVQHNFASGLEFPNHKRKPTFDAFRMPLFLPATSARHGRALEVWGCVRPAHFAALDTGSPQHVAIQFRRGSHGSFTTADTVTLTNVRGYFDVRVKFPASGAVRLQWAYPSGKPIYSRTVLIKVR